jgi:DNA-binding GntR family transcriptional regulator
MAAAREARDVGAYRGAQRASRAAWLEACGYPRLAKTILDLQDQDARVAVFLIMRSPERWARDLDASRRRLDAIAARDAAAALAVTRAWHDELLRELHLAIARDEDGIRGLLADAAGGPGADGGPEPAGP